MQELIDNTVQKLIKIIDSKPNSLKVARQFILEELDAAKGGTLFVIDRIQRFYINESEYRGAMDNSWYDVDGHDGPQQFLLSVCVFIAQKSNMETMAAVRITVVEYVLKHYNLGRYYLNSEVRIAIKPLALFDLVVEEKKLHSNFKYLLSDEYEPVRTVLNRWASGFEDRDNKFNREFQETFNSSFWELYLFQCFKDLDMRFDFSQASPDFTLETACGNLLNIEAVTSNHAQDSTPEWCSADVEVLDNTEFLNFSCVRLLNAISYKSKKYFSTYVQHDHVRENPFVIAVAPYEQPMFFIQNNEAIIRVLYAQGVDKENDFVEVVVSKAIKNKKTPLELGLFTNDEYKHISAIIFSTTATLGKVITQTSLKRDIRSSWYHPEKGLVMELRDNAMHFETHLDGLQVHHNPFAEKKLPLEEFDNYEITHYFYDPETKTIDVQQKPYTLISRNVWG